MEDVFQTPRRKDSQCRLNPFDGTPVSSHELDQHMFENTSLPEESFEATLSRLDADEMDFEQNHWDITPSAVRKMSSQLNTPMVQNAMIEANAKLSPTSYFSKPELPLGSLDGKLSTPFRVCFTSPFLSNVPSLSSIVLWIENTPETLTRRDSRVSILV